MLDVYNFPLFLQTVCKFTDGWQPWLWSAEQEISVINEQHCQVCKAAF